MPITARSTHKKRFNNRLTRVALAVAICVFVSACTKTDQTGPTIYSSASSLSYATEYPSRLEALNQKFVDSSAKARSDWESFEGFVSELKQPRWDQVKTVYQQADAAGRSDAIVQWMRQSGYITAFIESNDGAFAQRIGSHVNAQINKESGPAVDDFDSRPFVRWALKDSTSKLIEKRYQELNEAHRFVDMYSDTLGKKNLKDLGQQADTITEASFIVYIALIDLRHQMQARMEEADDVKNTLDNEIEGLQLVANDPDGTKEAKAAANKRIAELLKIKAPIDAHIEKAQALGEQFEQRLETIQNAYQEAFDKLIASVEQKERETPQP